MRERGIFGTRLRSRRRQLGLSQQQLAVQVGMRVASISRYETGEYHEMALTRLRDIAQVLQTSADFLLGLTNDAGPLPDDAQAGQAER
jgi:transcriptional regulator with XRE-family HTH domain